FSQICGAEIPLWIKKRMEAYADDPQAQKELGIEIATRQAEELLDNGVPGIHFYTLNEAEPTLRIAKNLGLLEKEAIY
ncbi:methylenetetrahydrofolate reductase, partial [Candidatus Bipolaricaulota bacterium]|nr:methylenetetrahydrofolate reductase [Candidatus Bipolaricaulota bacterium]